LSLLKTQGLASRVEDGESRGWAEPSLGKVECRAAGEMLLYPVLTTTPSSQADSLFCNKQPAARLYFSKSSPRAGWAQSCPPNGLARPRTIGFSPPARFPFLGAATCSLEGTKCEKKNWAGSGTL
jgi:hypothetical protein